MPFGRLIRVRKRGDPHGVAYVTAVRDPADAIDLIRWTIGASDDEIEDVGRVSDELLKALGLVPGEFICADPPHTRTR